MASIESEILKRLHEALNEHAHISVSASYTGNDQSVALSAGTRQGVYRGIKNAIDMINGLLEDKANKDNLL